jgi:hypothetical protein
MRFWVGIDGRSVTWKTYNDGGRYILHYVTAREGVPAWLGPRLTGKRGDPRQYYDYLIPPYVAAQGGNRRHSVAHGRGRVDVFVSACADRDEASHVSASAGLSKKLSRQHPPFHHCGRLRQISRIDAVPGARSVAFL